MIRVDYAGPGGACEGIRSLGLDSYGIEWDAAACRTRAAAGHLTIRADLSTYRPGGSPEGYWSSPPCQTFSTAGKGDGRDQLDALAEVIHAERWVDADLFDDRTRHVIDAARTAVELHPEWIAMEQVPAVLPLWRALAHVLEQHGYSTWAGVLCAANYGVPQTRERAVLMASRGCVAMPPPPTHAEVPGMFGEQPWVSWGEALGAPGDFEVVGRRGAGMCDRHGERPPTPTTEPFPTTTTGAHRRHWLIDRRTNSRGPGGTVVPTVEVPSSRPAPTLTSQAGNQWVLRHGAQKNAAVRTADQPAATVLASWDNGDTRLVDPAGNGRYRLTLRGALVIQGFDPSMRVIGTKEQQFEQVGNAVPPPLAAAVVGALAGRGRR